MRHPIYHLRDEQELGFVAVAYQDGPGLVTLARLTPRFNVSAERSASVIKAAHKSLADVMRRDF